MMSDLPIEVYGIYLLVRLVPDEDAAIQLKEVSTLACDMTHGRLPVRRSPGCLSSTRNSGLECQSPPHGNNRSLGKARYRGERPKIAKSKAANPTRLLRVCPASAATSGFDERLNSIERGSPVCSPAIAASGRATLSRPAEQLNEMTPVSRWIALITANSRCRGRERDPSSRGSAAGSGWWITVTPRATRSPVLRTGSA